MKVAIVYHSGHGHTRVVAEAIADGANQMEGVWADLVHVTEIESPDQLSQYDGMVFGSPTYMGL